MTKTKLKQNHHIHYVQVSEVRSKDGFNVYIPELAEIDDAYFVNQIGKNVPVKLRVSLKYKSVSGNAPNYRHGLLFYSNMDDVKRLMDDFHAERDKELIGKSVTAYRLENLCIVGIQKTD